MTRGFASMGILIALIAVVLIGGGGYYVMSGQTTFTFEKPVGNTEELTTVQDFEKNTEETKKKEQATIATKKITISSPATGAVLPADKETTVRWSVPPSILNSFPSDFEVYVFMYVRKEGDQPGVNVAGIGDGLIARNGAVTWDIPLYISTGSLVPGTYKIFAQLQVQPKDAKRMCARSLGGGECGPSEADAAIMSRANPIVDETGWFTISKPSGTQSVSLGKSEKYSMMLPAHWHIEKKTEVFGGGIETHVTQVYDGSNLVLKIQSPLREIGYESMYSMQRSTLQSGIGTLETVLRLDPATIVGEQSVDMASGFKQYWWSGGNDFWNDSFEIFVYFNPNMPLRWKSLGEFRADTSVEAILKTIQ